MAEAIVNVHNASNTSFLRLRFTGGLPNKSNGMFPAIYMETNKIFQQIIEDSPEFQSGMIFVHKIYGTDEPEEVVEQKPAPAEPKAEKQTEFPDVTTREELLKVLKANGAKASTLIDDEAIAKFIERKGLSFPNYEF